MVDTWGNFSLKKEIPTTLKYFLKKIYDSFWNKTLGQDNFGKFFFKCNIAIKHFEQYIMNVTYE